MVEIRLAQGWRRERFVYIKCHYFSIEEAIWECSFIYTELIQNSSPALGDQLEETG